MDGEDLDGGLVAVQATGALAGSRCAPRPSARAARPAARSTPRCSWGRASCSDLATCRRSVISRSPPTLPSTRVASLGCRGLEHGRHAACCSRSPQSRSVPAIRSVISSPRPSSSAAVSPKNAVRPAARTRPLRCGCSIASSSVSHSSAPSVANTLPPRRSPPGPRPRRARRRRTRPGGGSRTARRRRRRQRRAVERGPGREQLAHIGGEVAATTCCRSGSISAVLCLRRTAPGRPPGAGTAAACGAPGRRCSGWCASTSRTTISLVAELGAAQQRLHPVEQRRVGAVVGAERRDRARGRRGAAGR